MSTPLQSTLDSLDLLKAKLDAIRPLPPHTVASLREKLLLEWIYHSNAIEGDTLTLRETKVVLEGITVGGKTLREHLEATNHRDAIEYVEHLASENIELDEWQIKNIHSLVLKSIDVDQAGRYRNENVTISGASTTPPHFLQVDQLMRELIIWHRQAVNTLHPVDGTEHYDRITHLIAQGAVRSIQLYLDLVQ